MVRRRTRGVTGELQPIPMIMPQCGSSCARTSCNMHLHANRLAHGILDECMGREHGSVEADTRCTYLLCTQFVTSSHLCGLLCVACSLCLLCWKSERSAARRERPVCDKYSLMMNRTRCRSRNQADLFATITEPRRLSRDLLYGVVELYMYFEWEFAYGFTLHPIFALHT